MVTLNCKITKVGDERRTKNPGKDGKTHRYRWVEATELSLGKQYEVCMYNNGLEWNLNVGDTVVLSVNEIKTMPGKYSGGLDKVVPIVKETPAPEEKKNGPNWDMKDRRMARMNALSHAVKTVELSLSSKEALGEDTIAGLVMKTAEIYEDWIYRTDAPEEEVAPF